jgi:hypothetical protein
MPLVTLWKRKLAAMSAHVVVQNVGEAADTPAVAEPAVCGVAANKAIPNIAEAVRTDEGAAVQSNTDALLTAVPFGKVVIKVAVVLDVQSPPAHPNSMPVGRHPHPITD